MDVEVKNKIIQAIQTAKKEEDLGAYLMKVGAWFAQPKYDSTTITMRQSNRNLLKNTKKTFRITLNEPRFKNISQFFALTPGLHVIGAPSGHGKTMWAMEWASEAAKSGENVLILSLEMTERDLSARNLSQMSEIPLADFARDSLSELQKGMLLNLNDSSEYNYLDNIHIDKMGDYDWVKIKPRLISRMADLRPKLIVIDYIQMISNSDEDDFRTSKMLAELAREMKLFADQTGSAVLVLSQLNREAIKTIKSHRLDSMNQIPLSNDYIKESGGIVEAADSVQLVCMPQRLMVCPQHLFGLFQVTVDKSRSMGTLSTAMLPFDYDRMKFR